MAKAERSRRRQDSGHRRVLNIEYPGSDLPKPLQWRSETCSESHLSKRWGGPYRALKAFLLVDNDPHKIRV
jgi:hypothetical protein